MQTRSARTIISAAAATAAIAAGVLGAAAIAAPAAVAATVTAPALAVASANAAVAAPALRAWPVLSQGTNSSWPKVTVRSLQYLLNARGAKLTVDGAFGANTKAAVVAFQRAHHLTADGVAGKLTWSALLVTVKLGSTGSAVRAVQDQANFRNGKGGQTLTVDGVFGAKTQSWVKAFQQAIGIPADGVVGALTWQALVTESLSF